MSDLNARLAAAESALEHDSASSGDRSLDVTVVFTQTELSETTGERKVTPIACPPEDLELVSTWTDEPNGVVRVFSPRNPAGCSQTGDGASRGLS